MVLFATTNVDDVFVLLGFFSDPKFHPRQIVIGQYLGIAVLYGVSVLASLLALVVPAAYIGLLGLAPIYLGARSLYSVWRGDDNDADESDGHRKAASRSTGNILTVATVTIANGGDNISIYTPLFATRPAIDIAVIGLVFTVLTAVWCRAGHWLVHHPALGAPLRRYGHRVVPYVLIGLGLFILYEANTFSLLPGRLDGWYRPAVDHIFATCNRRRAIGNEESDQLCHFLRSPRTSERNSSQRVHQHCPRCSFAGARSVG